MGLFLVRHAEPEIDPTRDATTWELAPGAEAQLEAIAAQLPPDARHFSSPEPKAIATARMLTAEPVEVVADLREHERGAAWIDDYETTVVRALLRPIEAAYDGWATCFRTQQRVAAAVQRLLDRLPGKDLVLVGHGIAWTLLVAEFTDSDPDPELWASLGMPDLVVLQPPS
ncbi:MAG TPA: histidine phosphatase family protein [Marmoricola sp.]|jgi:broad specificity phosphatase PhoE|nr:histidine phosphatase family protein [Marmoricola sp.]